jgi:hypothetical protein
MGPNDVELVRVWTKDPAKPIQDVTLSITANFDVIVEAEAGSTIFKDKAPFQTDIYVRDLSDHTNIPTLPVGGYSGTMNGLAWPANHQVFPPFTIKNTDLTDRANHICQVVAYLTVTTDGEPDVSFAESPIFILTA